MYNGLKSKHSFRVPFFGISTNMIPNKANILLKSGGEDTDKVDRIKKDFGFEPQLARNNF